MMTRLILLLLALTIAVGTPAQNRSTRRTQRTTNQQRRTNTNQQRRTNNNQRRRTNNNQRRRTNNNQQRRSSQQLRGDRSAVERRMQGNQQQLRANREEQAQKTRMINQIEADIQLRVEHIHQLEHNIDSVEHEVDSLQARCDSLTAQLNLKRERYAQALRYARRQSLNLSPTIFVLAGNTPTQMIRRSRYARQYATYQRQLGEEVIRKRDEALTAKGLLLAKKDELNTALQELCTQRRQLAGEQQRQRDILAGLVRVERNLNQELARQQQQIEQLNRDIERQVAYEVEQARLQREAEERRQREAAERRRREEEERRRRAAATQTARGNQGGTQTARGNQGGTQGNRGGTQGNRGGTQTARGNQGGTQGNRGGTTTTTADRAMTGTFEQNRGRLPAPITGSYRVTGRFGNYTPAGTRGVTLNSKGVSYTGDANSRARVVFDGRVSAVVSSGGKQHVLVRHGSYITVYCNLRSVIVRQGQQVKARDLLGAIAPDEHGHYTMQLQLYRERQLIDPYPWISR